ncbi:biotin/lipoate--protein ligase family protein [Hwanghaeella sp.]|uniref:biotin/lipoate--protein ligase family protein n=1 Tax=Hwanghaeella sp. TaxID=2605943 RepID=UPI003CCC0AF8
MTDAANKPGTGQVPALPPIFTPILAGPTESPLDLALAAVDREEDATGTVVVADRADIADAAFILGPDRPLMDALKVVHVMMVSVNDALGSIIPPQIAITFGWPDRIMINGALAGGLRLTLPEEIGPDSAKADPVPDWMILRVTIDVLGEPTSDALGKPVERTSLMHEGCVDVAPTLIVESIARHFLSWVSKWETDGFDPVRNAWDGRAEGYQEKVAFKLPAGSIKGRLLGLDEDGGLMVSRDGKKRRAPLRWLLQGASWNEK